MSLPASPNHVRKALSLLLLGVTLLAVTVHMTQGLYNADTFFHLRLGAEFLHGWDFASPGSTSRYATAEWTPTQWLSQVSMARVEEFAGLSGVAWLAGTAVLALALTFFFIARARGGLLVAAVLTPLALVACSPGLSARPQVVSYLLCAVFAHLWLRTAQGGTVPWVVVPLTWLWSLLHGMWILGVALTALGAFSTLVARGPRTVPGRVLLAVVGCTVLVPLASPLGLDAYRAVIRVGGISQYFSEWRSPELLSPPMAPATLMAAVLLVLLLRSRTAARWPTLLFLGAALAAMVHSTRTVPVAVCLMLPLLADAIAPHLPALRNSRRDALAALGLCLAATLALVPLAHHRVSTAPHATSAAHRSVASLPAGTGLLNEWDEGGFDLWLHPDLDVVAHGYGDMFTASEIERNNDLPDLNPGWYDHVTGLRLSEALLYADGRLAQALQEDKGWTVVAEDRAVRAPEADVSDHAGQRPGMRPLVHLRAPAETSEVSRKAAERR